MREERHGSGEYSYFRGRRFFLGTVVFCYITLLCRMAFLTDGNGYLTQSKVTQSVIFTTCLQHLTRPLSRLIRLPFGSNTSLLRFLYLCGVSSANVFQQRIISSQGELFRQMIMYAWEVAKFRSQPITSSLLVTILVSYGRSFVVGFAFLGSILFVLLIIFTNSAN